MSRKSRAALWILFAVFILIRVTVKINTGIVLDVLTSVTAVVILAGSGMPSRKHLLLSIVFSAAVSAAYLGYQQNAAILRYGLLRAGIPTLLTSLAVFAVMEKRGGYEMLTNRKKYGAKGSILLGVLTGIVLSVINTVISYFSGEFVEFEFSLWKLFLCLNPAIYEEMACRAIFMAYCVWFSQGRTMSRADLITMVFMMIVPHTIAHQYGLIETVMLSVLFGLPFALLQRKRDITSAMISHGLVDAVRFTLTGF